MRRTASAFIFALALAASGAAHAGPYGDEMAKCVMGKTTEPERTSLVVWLFAEMSAHPALKPMANVSDAQRTDASKTAAALVQRLVTQDCRTQAAAALRNEGAGVLMGVFWGVAQGSIGALARDPAVAANLQQIGQYLDTAKLAAIMNDPAPAK